MTGNINKKAYMGLSGGVDSAVSAALLKKEGYEVTGVFIKAWTPPGYKCTWREDRRSAMRAAAVLDIPFVTLDLDKEYKEKVADYMISEYRAGRTPNPDVMCNKEIKFGSFYNWAIANGADYVATGHYAQVVERPSPASRRGVEGEVLKEGKDKNKDQSYFLWTLTNEQLKHVLFPIGHLQKSEVRKLAAKFKLPQAARKDSQGLCFLGQVDMKEFLKDYIDEKRGDVLDESGKIIGYHNGTLFFTLGERHGFTITARTPDDKPMYIVAKNVKDNTITVSPNKHPARPSNLFILENVNWINEEVPKGEISCRYRYRQDKLDCKIEKRNDGRIEVQFSEPQLISPGQSIVFYNDEVCLGGAVIV
jgi:tRNA-uridine 2-sulfurtransferase